MENKGIAINTILLLVVGTITVVVIVYLVYHVTTTPVLSMQECKRTIIQYCTLCANLDFGNLYGTPQKVVECGQKYSEFSTWIDNAGGNCRDGPATGETERECKALGVG